MTELSLETRHWPIIRVFVSSTFADLNHERNALQKDVFPRLEELCLNRRFQFQAIDLRWGVPTEAGLDHRTMRICFEELRRAQQVSPLPNFLILLGDRYGWRPLPEEITAAEFQHLEATALRLDGGIAGGPSLATLKQWYPCDANAIPPVHILRSRRQQDPITTADFTDNNIWQRVQDTLWRIVNDAFPASGLESRFQEFQSGEHVSTTDAALPEAVRFQASATEQEIWYGAFRVPQAREHVVAVVRKIENLEHFKGDSRSRDFVDRDGRNEIDPVSRKALLQLREQLTGQLKYVYSTEGVQLVEVPVEMGKPRLDITVDHLPPLCVAVYEQLKELIEQQMDQWESASTEDADQPDTADMTQQLRLERNSHLRFAEERAPQGAVVGRELETGQILDYLARIDTRLLVIHGAAGSGKTALMAYAARRALISHPRSVSLARFLGTTSQSSDVHSLMQNLCRELRRVFPLEAEFPAEFTELVNEFYNQLSQATADQPIHVFLDALDQLETAQQSSPVAWLRSTPLPQHAKIVVSCLSVELDDQQATVPFHSLQQRDLLANQVALTHLTPADAHTLLFQTWLPRANRTVNKEQQLAILARINPESAHECRTPLYLKILFEEARRWRSFDGATELGSSVAALLGNMLDRLRRSSEHGLTVEVATRYLVSARYGLAENELLEVLFDDPDYKSWLNSATEKNRHELPVGAKRIPIAIWARLRFDLANYLLERGAPGGQVLHFYHRQVAAAIRRQFVNKAADASHSRLAKYFHKRLDPQRDLTWVGTDIHAFAELPWQLAHASDWPLLQRTLCDLHFIRAKCDIGMTDELRQDFRFAKPRVAPEEISASTGTLHHARRPSSDTTALRAALASTRNELDPDLSAAKYRLGDVIPEEFFSAPGAGRDALEKYHRTLSPPTDRVASSDPQSGQLAQYEMFVDRNATALRGKDRDVLPLAYNWAATGSVTEQAEKLLQKRTGPWIARGNRPPLPGVNSLFERVLDHPKEVDAMALSPDGTRAYTATNGETHLKTKRNGILRCWDFSTADLLFEVGSLASNLTVLSDGRSLVGLSQPEEGFSVEDFNKKALSFRTGKGYLAVWDADTGHRTFIGLERLNHLAVAADAGIAICAYTEIESTKVISIWDLATCLQAAEIPISNFGVKDLAISADGRIIAALGTDNRIRLWDRSTLKCVRSILVAEVVPAPPPVSGGLGFGFFDNKFSGELLNRAVAHRNGTVKRIVITPDASLLVSIHNDGAVNVWHSASGRYLRSLNQERQSITDVDISADGRLLSLVRDNLEVWDLSTLECVRRFSCHALHLSGVRLTHDCCKAVTWSGDIFGFTENKVRVWNLVDGQEDSVVDEHRFFSKTCIAASPNGAAIWLGSMHAHCVLSADGRNATLTSYVQTPNDVVTDILLTQDSQMVAWGSHQHPGFPGFSAENPHAGARLRILLTESRRYLREFSLGDRGAPGRVAASPDGRDFAAVSDMTGLKAWDLSTGVLEFEADTPGASALSLSPDGESAVIGFQYGSLQVWDVCSGERLSTFGVSTAQIMCVAVSPDGQTAAVAGEDGGLTICDLRTGTLLAYWSTNRERVQHVRFSVDGQLLLTSSFDRTVRVWDVETQECLAIHYAGCLVWGTSDPGIHGRFSCACSDGDIPLLSLRGYTPSAAWVTAVRHWRVDPDLVFANWLNSQSSPPGPFGEPLPLSDWVPARLREIADNWEPLCPDGATVAGQFDYRVTITCPNCSVTLPVPDQILQILSEVSDTAEGPPGLTLPLSAWQDDRLATPCAQCGCALRYNPFLIDRRSAAEARRADEEILDFKSYLQGMNQLLSHSNPNRQVELMRLLISIRQHEQDPFQYVKGLFQRASSMLDEDLLRLTIEVAELIGVRE